MSHLSSCLTHPTDLIKGDMCAAPIQVAQFLAGLSQFANLPHSRSTLIPFLLSLTPAGITLLTLIPGWTISTSSFLLSYHLISFLLVRRLVPPSHNNKNISSSVSHTLDYSNCKNCNIYTSNKICTGVRHSSTKEDRYI